MEPRCFELPLNDENDEFCPTPLECFSYINGELCYRGYYWEEGSRLSSQCLDEVDCNWMSCHGLNATACQEACLDDVPPNVCLLCEGNVIVFFWIVIFESYLSSQGGTCTEVPELTTQSACEAGLLIVRYDVMTFWTLLNILSVGWVLWHEVCVSKRHWNWVPHPSRMRERWFLWGKRWRCRYSKHFQPL